MNDSVRDRLHERIYRTSHVVRLRSLGGGREMFEVGHELSDPP